MPVPKTKSELLSAIETEFRKLDQELESLPMAASYERSMDGHAKGTTMSPHDLVAYLVGWNELILKWHARRSAGQSVDFPETGFKWNELGRLAQKFYRDYESTLFPKLVKRLRDAKTKLIALIEDHDDQALYGQPFYERWPLGRMIQWNSSSPYANASARLRRWRKHRTSTPERSGDTPPRLHARTATKGRRRSQPPSADAK